MYCHNNQFFEKLHNMGRITKGHFFLDGRGNNYWNETCTAYGLSDMEKIAESSEIWRAF